MLIQLMCADTLVPFMLEGGQVRGRIVRLGNVAEKVLGQYEYPPAVASMLGELLLSAAMLSANLKHEGIFTLQVRGHGVVPLVVVDAVHGGALRGFADVPEAAYAAIDALENPTPRALLGEGAYLAITFDPGEGGERYQGIVALEGDSIADALMAYFSHSQQLAVGIQLCVSPPPDYRAAGLMIERMPDVGDSETADEAWRYATAIAATVSAEELLAPMLNIQDFLYRLFHEVGVWVYDPHTLTTGCRCSRARILGILTGMSALDRADMVVDGQVSVHCQFCNTFEYFTPEELGI